jgi:hypothetical protein
MTPEQNRTYEALLSGGYGCEAAYYAAFEAGETPMGADEVSAIGKAALNGLMHRNRGERYAYSYADCI